MNATKHQRTRAQLGDSIRQWLPWLMCYLLLPLPIPALHRHDDIEASQTLSEHLSLQHCEPSCQFPMLDEAHWHLVLPSSRFSDDAHEEGLPATQTKIMVAGQSCIALTVEQASRGTCETTIACSVGSLTTSPAEDVRVTFASLRCARGALQRQQSANSCVMRC